MNMTNYVKTVLCKSAVAAGATDITDATAIDMAGYDACRFIFSFGTITAGAATSVAVAALDTSSPTPGTDDLAGSKITVADDADNTLFILDIVRPRYRYLRPFIKRATQNAVVNCVIAELYRKSGALPVAKDSTVTAQEIHVSTAQGAA